MAIKDFLDMMPDTITHEPLTGRDDYGKPTHGASVEYPARVVYKAKWLEAKDGSQVLAKAIVWIGGIPTISPEDKIVLPDSTTPPILSIERYPDEDGLHHVKVFFGG